MTTRQKKVIDCVAIVLGLGVACGMLYISLYPDPNSVFVVIFPGICTYGLFVIPMIWIIHRAQYGWFPKHTKALIAYKQQRAWEKGSKESSKVNSQLRK